VIERKKKYLKEASNRIANGSVKSREKTLNQGILHWTICLL